MALVAFMPCRRCLYRLTSVGTETGSLSRIPDWNWKTSISRSVSSAGSYKTIHFRSCSVNKIATAQYLNVKGKELLSSNLSPSPSSCSIPHRLHNTNSEPKVDVQNRLKNLNAEDGKSYNPTRSSGITTSVSNSYHGVPTAAQSVARQKRPEERIWLEPEGYNTGIYMYNSLTRRKEKLILPNGRIASWYMCGPTVYDQAHIGHASSYVRTDIIRRIMMNMFNIDIVMVMGVTDIDDKIIKRSKELKMDFKRMARKYEQEFFRDMTALKVLPPTVKTRVTEHIPAVIAFIQCIMDNDKAYRTPSGSVYFDVQSYGRYGRLWTHSLETEIRDPADKEKRYARDFALWKAAKPGEPYWESPWGRGRPGWHIECSTMASAIFGEKLDVHSGGDDLRFPHHENEMAQSEACFCSKQWTNYWLHTGYLHLKNDKFKMSKSLKNTIRVSELLESYTANQFRIFCMLRPYRQLVEYNEESMLKAVRIHSGWASFLSTAEAYITGQLNCQPINEAFLTQSLEETKVKVESALSDDFDTPRAILAMEELVHRANIELGRKPSSQAAGGSRSPGVIAAVVAYVERIMELWGIQVSQKKAQGSSDAEEKFMNAMDSVVKFRGRVRNIGLQAAKTEALDTDGTLTDATKKKQSKEMSPLLEACDELRDDLRQSGVKIQDHGTESTWTIQDQKSITSSYGER